MKKIYSRIVVLAALLSLLQLESKAQANTALSNLSVTAVNTDLLPGTTNTLSLGSSTLGWKDLYLNDALYLGGARFLTYTSSVSLQNTGVGASTLFANTTGHNNSALGSNALKGNITGYNNVAVGYNSLQQSQASHNNVAVGVSTLQYNSNGFSNTAVGNKALYTNVRGSNNTALGANSLNSNYSGSANVAIGIRAMYSNKVNSKQVAIGDSALFSNNGGTGLNTAVGSKALYSTTTGSMNTAVGYQSLQANTTGDGNVALGALALTANTTGSGNTAVGVNAMLLNTSGSNNAALGVSALGKNTTGSDNVAFGPGALTSSKTADGNVGMGHAALALNESGSENVGVGDVALNNLITGNSNVAVGASSLFNAKDGSFNTVLGGKSMLNIISGSRNTALGYLSDVDSDYSNVTVIGSYAIATANNQVMLGDVNVTSVVAAGSYMIYSDGRFKKDVKADIPGLAFINTLRPVSYTYDIHGIDRAIGGPDIRSKAPQAAGKNGSKSPTSSGDAAAREAAMNAKEKKVYTGFIAQEVEASAKKLNYSFSGLHVPENDKDLYALSYSDFVPPLVKSVQELSAKDSVKQAKIDSLRAGLDSVRKQIAAVLQSLQISSTRAGLSDAALIQNTPNPFRQSTVINFTLPATYGRAKIMVTDMSGKVVRSIPVKGTGAGNLTLDASNLASGVYTYGLYVDEALIGSKQMIHKN